MVDEPATLRDSPFPIKESDLINKCKVDYLQIIKFLSIIEL